ncbi:MAG: winged helix-turn-helix transcriptional regulator [Bacteroidales bacterium]|nr:winged helix-turn-helix transcriptional regulator [Bacteroidales bacterium]
MTHARSVEFPKDMEQIARFAKALSHPARVAILKILSKSNSCFCGDIVSELPLAQATVSQHLKELKASGLITGQIEPPRVCYCLDPKNWEIASKVFCDFFKAQEVFQTFKIEK